MLSHFCRADAAERMDFLRFSDNTEPDQPWVKKNKTTTETDPMQYEIGKDRPVRQVWEQMPGSASRDFTGSGVDVSI